MVAIIHQPLADIHGGNVVFFLALVRKNYLVHTQAVLWKVIVLLEPCLDVVGVQHRVLSHLT